MYQISIKKRNVFDTWRAKANFYHLSEDAKRKLEWMVFYYSVGEYCIVKTCQYFGITRKTFHKWKKRFDGGRVTLLEEKSRKPKQVRVSTVTKEEEENVKKLRVDSKCIWGKEKLRVEYKRIYGKYLSTNKIQKVINKFNLYPDEIERKKQIKRLKQRNLRPKLRIYQFKKENPSTIIWHIDTVQIVWYGQKKYIFTALEDKTKLAFARIYETPSSKRATDFLKRLLYLTDNQMKVIHSDNGGEFKAYFEKACTDLNILQVYSRIKTPKDNPALERFNRTIQDEWLSVSEVGLDNTFKANLDLTQWLIKYNFQRPHQTLAYKTPIEYANINYPEVLPMYPARTEN